MPNPVKSLGYIKSYRSSSRIPVKSPNNSIRNNCQKIFNWSRRPKTILEIRKVATFLQVIKNSIAYMFLKTLLTTERILNTNRVVVFSSRPFSNILKYRDHRWDFPAILKRRLFQTEIEEFSKYVWKLGLTILSKHHWKTIRTRCLWCIKVRYDLFNHLRVTEILRSFRLVLERQTGKEITESSRLEFLEKFSANNFALSDAQDNTSGL